MPRSNTVPKRAALAEAAILLIVAAMAWYFVYLRYRVNRELPLATLEALTAGTAYKPFQFRVLVPWLARELSRLGFGPLLDIYKSIDWVATVAIYYSVRYYLKTYLSGTASALLAFAVFWVLPWNFIMARDIPIYLPYDLTVIVFMTLALAFLVRRQWIPFYIIFIAATFNRETTIFITAAFVSIEWGLRSKNSLAVHAATQFAIWGGVKLLTGSLYAGNPGSTLEFDHADTTISHWRTNIDFLTTPKHLLVFLSNFGFLWLLLIAGWDRLMRYRLRRTLWIIPAVVLTTFFIANINELRIYADLFPFVLIPALLVIVSVVQNAERDTSAQP